MSKKGDSIVIWPAYIDSEKTRAQGRMVSKALAVEAPTADEIFNACSELKMIPTIEPSKKMPGGWWERPGRVLIPKKEKKIKSLLAISKFIQRKRQQQKK